MGILQRLGGAKAALEQQVAVTRKRIETCNVCPSRSVHIVLGVQTTVCGICGCNMLAKASIPTTICPSNKWETQEDIK